MEYIGVHKQFEYFKFLQEIVCFNQTAIIKKKDENRNKTNKNDNARQLNN